MIQIVVQAQQGQELLCLRVPDASRGHDAPGAAGRVVPRGSGGKVPGDGSLAVLLQPGVQLLNLCLSHSSALAAHPCMLSMA